jgi:hypothetical protein
MLPTARLRYLALTLSCGGWLLAGSCFTSAFQNLDLLLSRNAVDAALRLPFAPVGQLVEFLLQTTNFFR